jgi:hypothetical protein
MPLLDAAADGAVIFERHIIRHAIDAAIDACLLMR